MQRLSIAILSLAVALTACGGSAPTLSATESEWWQQLTNAGAVLAAAKELGIDAQKEILVEDWAERDGYKRACKAAYDNAH